MQIHILDAGCGSGKYMKEFLDSGIGKVSLFDSSEPALSKARDILASYESNKKVEVIKLGSLPQIPFPDNSFDVVLFMQVLQHLDKPFTEFANLKLSITEAFRVLKPGGVLLINHSTHDQLRYGSWYANLMPHTVEKLCDKFIPQNELLSVLEKTGFKNATCVSSPWEMPLSPDVYYRKDGPLDAAWRKLDKLWEMAEEEGELDSALKSLKEKTDFDMMDEWFNNVEEKRRSVGRTVSIFVQKAGR